ncbi:hypothetical protein PHLGIDRAFT_173036 [Phlebiopsis gigantea 11061_1 CR5-6]|uniref:ATP-dependent DNA helicase II subunit 1 n=1 Tax=Phlebiopsis gigantea (strain 11061_1 CR5-6) TaxID=745531 RepID=A0A0C3NZW5_PHLG1|nr:hypothetical protein PHLGIDRAFT_173036 [Phlebiopsis gigantea 11061_1 CR5-6]
MASYEDWNRIDDEDDEELQDSSWYEGKKDVILFAIDCSESMHEPRDDPEYEDVKTCHVLRALEAAMQIQKRKVIVGPSDSVGIMMFNTTRRNDATDQGSEIKKGNFVFQAISTINSPKVQELIQLIDTARQEPDFLRETFPPLQGSRVPMGDVFTSCNWIMRDGAPKTATKRVFLITNEDNPHSVPGGDRLLTSARTTLIDLTQAGIVVEPFFISSEEKPFDVSRFYSSVLLPTNLVEDDEEDGTLLPEAVSITRMEDLLSQMRFREVPKRALFSIPFELAENFVIGVKGYGLVTEQKKGSYKYFVDLGDRMEVAESRTVYSYQGGKQVDRSKIVYGMGLGEVVGGDKTEDHVDDQGGVTRTTSANSRVFYTADEMKSFRTLGLEPKIKLLGFKSRKELKFEHNVKHSFFIYPDEMTYSGSKRTFSALLKTMIKKKRIALALALTRRNASPVFCTLVPQAEKSEEGGWNEPAGFHLVPLPYADDMRATPDQCLNAARAPDELKDKARQFVEKLTVKNGSYPPDSYPNPALAFHNAQLEASAFREEFDPENFEDLTLPTYESLHKRAGHLIKDWKQALLEDESATLVVEPPAGSRRKAEFLKSKGEPVAGNKAVLVDRVGSWFDTHI